jgi:glycosyltransferase involved in cell wall biosynthesis
MNEEENLPRALECVQWCDDIVVVDSGSTDRTIEIAEAAGARVEHHPFENWAAQGNWALHNVEYKHPWVYYMDADEILPDALLKEIEHELENVDDSVAAFRLRYKNFYMDRWLRHATLYPTWITRLLRLGRVSYEERLVNPHPVCDGEVRELQEHFHHYSFHKGMEHWFAKHNRYSTSEASETMKSWEQDFPKGDLISRDPVKRRRALKLLSMRMPARPFLKFCYMYFWRRGFLDGYPGLSYCMLQSIYEAMIVAKVKEQQRAAKGLDM